MAKTSDQPSDLEMKVLSVLWDGGPCTVRTVLESLSDGKPRAYTTILSTMQVMEKKTLIKRNGAVSGALVYVPLVSRQDVTRPVLRQLLGSLFGGKPSAVMQQLLNDAPVDEEELLEIRRILDERSASNRKSAPRKKAGK